MIQKFSLIIIFHFFISVLCAQDLDYAKKVVSTLASPEFKGRGYIGNGDKLAATYIEEQFKANDLKPLNKTYFQEFKVAVHTFPVTPELKINGEILKPAVDYLVESSAPELSGTFKVVVIDRKIFADFDLLKEKIADAQDNFLLIDNRALKEEDKAMTQSINGLIDAIKYDPAVALKGVIFYSPEKLTWEASTNQQAKVIINLHKEMDISTIKTIVIKVESELKKKYETRNVCGMIEGTRKDSFIVITAHYDHLGMMGPDIYFPGANDNASGVAVMLNLAEYYKTHKPKYTTVFIALAAEELGLLGAKEFTENPLINLKKIKFLVNFDLAGTGDEGIKVVNGSIFKDKFDLLSKINAENKLLPKVEIRGEACISDHCMFYMKGVPCFYIYTLGGIKAYHDVDDRFETLPFTEFTDYVSLMIRFFDAL